MRQLYQDMRSGETRVVEVPMPVVRPGCALVQTAVSLVSAGTERMVVEFAEKSLLGKARSRPDLARQLIEKARREGLLPTLEAAFNRLDQPMPLGYSSAGTIHALGEGMQGMRIGERVACAGGGYAVHGEYALVPKNLMATLPASVDFESAAFTTLGAIALHGFRLAEPQVGERVAVIGLGLLGLLTVGIAQAAGCAVIGVDLDASRVALAEEMGAVGSVRQLAEEAAQAFSRGRGVDAVLICADTPSADPIELAGAIARDRARVVAVGAVGLNLPRKVYYQKELSFINSRSYGPGRYDPNYEEAGVDYPIGYVRWSEGRNLEAFVDLLAGRRLDVTRLITHRFPIEQAPQAYELITGKAGEAFLGVLLTYSASTPPSVIEIPHLEPMGEPHPLPAPGKVRLGVLGAGNFASAVMLPVLKKNTQIELVGIASAAGLHAAHAAAKFSFQYAAEGESQLLNDPQINTIAILTRHNLHASQVIAALRAGKHVFCEKPLAVDSDQLHMIQKQLAADYSSNNQPLLTVGFNRRFAPLAQRLADFLEYRQEPLVAYYRVNAGYLPPDHWLHDTKQGGGRIIGEGCHFIDFLTFLAGAPPVSVTAQALPDACRYREDNVILTCTFPDGSLGVLSYLANGDKTFPKERLEVFTSGRIAVLDDFRSLETSYAGKREHYHSRLRQDKGHRAEWEAFTSAIQNGGPPPIPYSHLFGVTRASFAAVDALRTSQSVRINLNNSE